MILFRKVLCISLLLITSHSFALSFGVIQKAKSGPYLYAWATQLEADSVCAQQGLKLPTAHELTQIAANPKNARDLKGACFWSDENGTLLMGDDRRIATGYLWSSVVAGIICR